MANRGCVALLGDFSNERLDVSSIARDFRWTVSPVSDVSGIREIGRSCTVVAVLMQPCALNMHWPDAVRAVRAAAPRARIIICHKVDQAHLRNQMIDAGAFGVLLTPLAYSEVRQSLGFVWASRITPLQHLPPAEKKSASMDTHAQRAGAA
jgi:DNA-binding NarL/FixJ family response regulator